MAACAGTTTEPGTPDALSNGSVSADILDASGAVVATASAACRAR